MEEQQAEAVSPANRSRPYLTPEEITARREREGLLLSRKRVLQQLEAVQHSQHREMLENALSELDAKLAKLG